MLENFIVEKSQKINEKAANEIKGIKYIVDSMSSNYEKIKEAFALEMEVYRNYRDEEENLFYNIEQLILENENFLERHIGVTYCFEKPENANTKLGWEEWKKFSDEKNCSFIKGITPEGKKVVNGYREARGLKKLNIL